MSAELQAYVDKPVNVITCDGRVIVIKGILQGFDQALNVVLSQCHERVFSLEEPVAVAQLGVYLIRGDNVAVLGEMDEERDGNIEYESLRAVALRAIVH